MCVSFLTWLFTYLYFVSECTEKSECPNGGKNFECNFNVCECATGFVRDDDFCVGMLPNWCFLWFQRTWFTVRSLRVDLGICISLRWIQVLGCVLDYKSFRSVRVDANKLLPKQKQKTIVTQPSGALHASVTL